MNDNIDEDAVERVDQAREEYKNRVHHTWDKLVEKHDVKEKLGELKDNSDIFSSEYFDKISEELPEFDKEYEKRLEWIRKDVEDTYNVEISGETLDTITESENGKTIHNDVTGIHYFKENGEKVEVEM